MLKTVFNYTVSAFFCMVVGFFVSMRIPEISTIVCTEVPGALVAGIATVGCVSLFLSPARTQWLLFRRIALITLAVAFVKQRMDHDLKLNLVSTNLAEHVTIVTGGTSGTGLSVAKLLVSLGSTVVITCRDQAKCNSTTRAIQDKFPGKKELISGMILDLNDLTSVKHFAKEFQKRYKRLDILVNNAGMIATPGAVTAQGLEQSFGAMHIGHFALTKYLLKLMLKPIAGGNNVLDAARVINLSADAMFVAGNFHPSLMTGTGGGDLKNEITDNCGMTGAIECCPFLACPNTNGYARAKLANAMHVYELQRRVDEYILASQSSSFGLKRSLRRLVTASLHPGSVATNIHGLLSSELTAPFLRSADQAAHVVLHAVLENSFVPSAYIDAMRVSHDLFSYRAHHLRQHLTAFPETSKLPFATEKESPYRITLHDALWKHHTLLYPRIDPAAPVDEDVVFDGAQMYRRDTVAARLWDVSEQIVSDWEANRPLLQTNVSTVIGKKLKL